MARASSVLPLLMAILVIANALSMICELNFGFESLPAKESSSLIPAGHPENSALHAQEHQRSDTEKEGCGDHDRALVGVLSLRTLAPQFVGITGFLVNLQEVPAYRQTVAGERLSGPGVTVPLSSQANPISLRI